MAVSVSVHNDSTIGITIAVPFLHYGLAAFSYIRVLNTDSSMRVGEYIMFAGAYLVQYGWGIAYIFIDFNAEQRDWRTPGTTFAGPFIVIYLIVIPFITSSIFSILKYLDDKDGFSVQFFI